MKISIVIPAYNEERSIGTVLEDLIQYLTYDAPRWEWEVVVVDDGSEDATAEAVGKVPGARLVRHPVNKGYGAALKTGIQSASGDVVVTMDADGQHTPTDVGRLLEDFDEWDMVVGARAHSQGSPLWRKPGKRVLGWLAEYLAEERIPDLNCGLRAVRKAVASRYLHLCPKGFSFSTTLTLALVDGGYRVTYVPITAQRRQSGSESTVKVRTGLQTLLLMLRIISLFGPLKLFLPTSLSLMALGLLWAAPYAMLGRGLSVGALLLILTGILLFFFGLLADQVAALRKEKYE